VDNTTSSLHPLCLPGTKISGISHTVLVLNGTIQQIGQGTKTSVWVRREPGNILIRTIAIKKIQQQKRVVLADCRTADAAIDDNPGAFLYGRCLDISGNLVFRIHLFSLVCSLASPLTHKVR